MDVLETVDPHIRRSIETFNDHELEPHMKEYAEGATFQDPATDGPISGDELHEYTADVMEAFPDIHMDPKRVIVDEDVTVLEITYSGTHEGVFEGLPPTGNYAELPAVTVMDVSDEGITSWRDYWDQQQFKEELGATFPEVVRHVPRILWWQLVK
jgi:steroid delta-isomerase-like uncharacterized protein